MVKKQPISSPQGAGEDPLLLQKQREREREREREKTVLSLESYINAIMSLATGGETRKCCWQEPPMDTKLSGWSLKKKLDVCMVYKYRFQKT
jgi:hypothetical protein